MGPTFFATATDFRNWLLNNHDKEKELLVGFYKTNSNKQSISWPESVDQALCFGWIDGIRKSRDETSYTIRFTPRKKTSIWSAINIRKMQELTENGLMQAAGLAAFEHRNEKRSKIYAYETEPKKLTPAFEKIFRSNQQAWDFFNQQAPSYQRTIVHWIMSAKQETTQRSRLTKTIEHSEQGKRLA